MDSLAPNECRSCYDELPQGCGNGPDGALAESPGGGPESRLWAAVVERGQEPEQLDQTENARNRFCTGLCTGNGDRSDQADALHVAPSNFATGT
jgi:hypothetical protein